MSNKNKGYFRYGVSAEERFENFFKAIKHNGSIVVARDTEIFTLNYLNGETLPVWLSKEEASAALPVGEWPYFHFDTYSCSEFVELYNGDGDGMFVSVRPDSKGDAKTIALKEFNRLISN
jgi:hypothetical protein